MKGGRVLYFAALGLVFAPGALADNVLEDAGVGMTREELSQSVKRWSPEMQKAAANDLGDRLELLNMVLSGKKIAAEADQLNPEEHGDLYWDYVNRVRAAKRTFMIEQFRKNLTVPDMTDLVEERYQTQKDKYAMVPERRLSSHILFRCLPGQCSRPEVREEAAEVLAALRAGADFEEMVVEYSDDPGSKAKGGRFDRWMTLGQQGVSPPYSGGVFEIENVGEYADLVESEFGVHIIRLDGIEEPYYRPLEEVRGAILRDLVNEYRQLAAKEYDAGYRLGDDAYIDGEALEEIFAPYKDK